MAPPLPVVAELPVKVVFVNVAVAPVSLKNAPPFVVAVLFVKVLPVKLAWAVPVL